MLPFDTGPVFLEYAGYPLYSMLAVLFHAILGGSPAWRVNLLSVVLASLGAYLHFLTIVRWDYWLAFDPTPAGAAARRNRLRRRGRWLPWEWSEGVCGAVVGTGLLSFCPLIWTYSTQAEASSLPTQNVVLLAASWFRRANQARLLRRRA